MRFAGDDVTRIAAIHRAAASGADVALISRGGYGLTRILPGIAYKKVAKAIEGGTQFVGLSDFTAFQLALLAKTGAISWAGPALGEDFGVEGEPDDIMEACFDDLVLDQGEGAGWRLPLERVSNTPEIVAKKDQETLGNGQLVTKNAVLWGGNLSVLVALLGTPYWPEVKGGVLFIEDVNEHPFRIERMLTQLLQAGVLGGRKPSCSASSPASGWRRTTRATSWPPWSPGCAASSRCRCSPACRSAMCRPRCCCRSARKWICWWKDATRWWCGGICRSGAPPACDRANRPG
jgi:hypothetical protein